MKNNIKTIALSVVVFILGCKKEELFVPDDQQTEYIHLNFDRINKTVETNLQKIAPFFDGEYSIKCLNYYRDQYGVDRVSKYSVFVNQDTGKIYLTGPQKIKYAAIKSVRMMDGFHLDFMEDQGYGDLSVTPSVVTDVTTELVVKNLKTGRSVKILASEFRTQGFWMVYYQ